MHIRVPLVFPVIALLALAAPAGAQSEYGTGEPTVYLGLSGLVSYDDIEDLGEYSNVDGGVTVRAGVRLGAPTAFELQGDYVRVNDWGDDKNWTMTANFRVYPTQLEGLEDLVPVMLQPYLVAGAGVMGGDPAGDKYQLSGAFRVGAGGDVYLTEQIAVSVGYEWLTGAGYWSERDVQNVTIGLQYNF